MSSTQASVSSAEERPPRGRDRILIVEDEEVIREVLVRFLEPAGYQVDQAPSAEEGLRQLSQHPYDLLLIDLHLPGMSGLQFLEAARRLDPSCGTLVLTGYGTLENAMAAMALGADGFLPKPVSAAQLLNAVANTLGRVRALRKQQRLQALRPVQAMAGTTLAESTPQEIAGHVLDALLGELAASVGMVFLHEDAGVRLAASRGVPGNAGPTLQEVGGLLQGTFGRWEGPLLLTEEGHRPGLYAGLHAFGLGSVLGVPLKAPSGPFGFLVLGRSREEPPWAPEDMDVAAALSGVGSLALHAAVLGQALREELQRGVAQGAAVQEQLQEAQQLRRLLQSREEEARTLGQRLELTWEAFGEVVDLRSGWRQGRGAQAVELVRGLAEASGLSRESLLEAALLHDVGLARASREGGGASTSQREEEERRHPADGTALLRQMGSPQEVVQAALHHHENYDGSGYPDGLAGNAIPFLGRVLRVVDSYLDLAYGVPGSPPLPQEAALARLRDGASSLFDPPLVERLARLLEAEGEGSPPHPPPG